MLVGNIGACERTTCKPKVGSGDSGMPEGTPDKVAAAATAAESSCGYRGCLPCRKLTYSGMGKPRLCIARRLPSGAQQNWHFCIGLVQACKRVKTDGSVLPHLLWLQVMEHQKAAAAALNHNEELQAEVSALRATLYKETQRAS